MAKHIFVFGSNRAGRHGAGAALHAKRYHGAIYGQGEGLQGRSYALPTKDGRLWTLPLSDIAHHVHTFMDFARSHPEMSFEVTKVGCGLAGYKETDIAPLFHQSGPIPDNVQLPTGW